MSERVPALVAACLVALAISAAPALAVPPPKLPVTGASLIVSGSDQQLWSENGNAELAIASATKLMTALVVLQHVSNLNEVFAQGDWVDQPGDSQIGLVPGEKMTVRDLLIAALVPSADDAAWDLAYNVGGHSISRFVGMMNAEAHALGLAHTHYSTPTGLDTPGNYSSPNDLVRLADYDVRMWPFLRQTVRLQSARIMIGDSSATVTNTDTLLGAVPWIDGIKTGHTDEAGYVLVSSGRRDGLTLIGDVLGTDSESERNASALALLDYGFAEFHRIKPLAPGQVLGHVKVAYSSQPATLVAAGGFSAVVPRTAKVRIEPTFPRQLSGPLAKGAVVGHVSILIAGKVATELPLVLNRRLPKISALTKVGHFLGRPVRLVLFALVIGAVVVVARRRRRPRVFAAGHSEER